MLTRLFKERIDNCRNLETLTKEMDIISGILSSNTNSYEIPELLEKLEYLVRATKRLWENTNELESSVEVYEYHMYNYVERYIKDIHSTLHIKESSAIIARKMIKGLSIKEIARIVSDMQKMEKRDSSPKSYFLLVVMNFFEKSYVRHHIS
ncbi:hypothetical protein [Mangrovibacillus cuniculi]|uniref:Uncharacterized protein n=1 Tax=Mangrovibacillus cuniculi TaxID=2593652 RepID=A0A7S8CCK1_9BACI|nr:hypothetical protein [Mangrovibacillus cuniculi]QPC47500.1 hypothetical protein G8O30_11355 [Mangrovibacillus cuniculi]